MSANKPWVDESKVGESAQHYYDFLEELWEGDSTPGDNLRSRLLSYSENELRDALVALKIIPPKTSIQVVLVDLESVTMNKFSVNVAQDFYTLVLPPKPRRELKAEPGQEEPTEKEKKAAKHEYMDGQAWRSAYYHALVDTHGM